MTVLATEAAAGGSAAGGAAAGSAGAAGGGTRGGFAGLASSAGAPQVSRETSKGVLLAIAILLLWLAGLCFFIAFEGSQLLAESSSVTGGGFLKAIVTGLARKAADTEQQGSG